MNMINFNTISIFNDAPQPWQFGFQDSAAPGFTGLVSLHNTIGFYLIIISLAVFWVFFSLIYSYGSKNHPIAHKYLTHGTVLELIWTITPALILIVVAFPSFRLLYLMDKPGLYHELAIITMVTTPISKIVSRTTDIIPFGVTSASISIRLNKHSRDITKFYTEIISQLVGHLLGKGSIHYTRTSLTPYFVFTQSIKQFEYIWSVYLTLNPYCGRVPFFNPGYRQGISHPFIQVMTRSYPALTPLHELFYQISVKPTGGNNYTKVITKDLLQYLNPISLAY